MKEADRDIFISFQEENREHIMKLQANLGVTYKISINTKSDEVNKQVSLKSYGTNDIKKAKTFLCCLTRNYVTSNECKRELMYAFRLNKPIIVLLEECDELKSHFFLKRYAGHFECLSFDGDLTVWLEANLSRIQSLIEQSLNVFLS